MRRKTKTRAFFLLLSIASAPFVLPGLQAETAAAEKKSCVTDQCHSTMGKGKYVHGPVALGECTYCHQPTGAHSFKAIKNVAKLCNECHDEKLTGKVVHPPVREKSCVKCHDPHQSPNPFHLFSP